jgi:hypothetical protein
MRTFEEWMKDNQLTEGRPSDWNAFPRLDSNIVASILKKIDRADKAGEMPFSGNFSGLDPIQTRCGFDDEEMEILRKSGLVSRTEYGYNINQEKFNDMFGKVGKPLNATVPGTEVPDWKDRQTQGYRPKSRTFPRVGSQPSSNISFSSIPGTN